MTDIKIRHRLWRCEYGFNYCLKPFVWGQNETLFFLFFCLPFLCAAKVLQIFGMRTHFAIKIPLFAFFLSLHRILHFYAQYSAKFTLNSYKICVKFVHFNPNICTFQKKSLPLHRKIQTQLRSDYESISKRLRVIFEPIP